MSEEIDRWVKFMRKNPKTWKKAHSEFIDTPFHKSYSFMKRISSMPDGKKRLKKIYNIKNESGYRNLLGKQGKVNLSGL